jgi:uncharacterized protein
MVNYTIVLFAYLPFLILIFMNVLRDRFNPVQKSLRLHNWSLIFPTIIIGLLTTGHLALSLWFQLPLLRRYQLNTVYWDFAGLCFLTVVLIGIYLCIRVVYKLSVIAAFNLKPIDLSFVFTICGVLTIIVFLSYYFGGVDLSFGPKKLANELNTSVDLHTAIPGYFVSIILSPIVEESVFRGLLYSALYRKVGRPIAIVLSSLLWTQGHFQGVYSSFGLFIIGLVLAWLYDRKGSLLDPIIFHIFRNSWGFLYLLAMILKG